MRACDLLYRLERVKARVRGYGVWHVVDLTALDSAAKSESIKTMTTQPANARNL